MEPRNVIMWAFLPVIVLLVMSTGVQAQELREVPAHTILEQIENGTDVYLENVRITGELNISKIELETVPVERLELDVGFGLEKELKIVESEITIKDSVFENDVDFSNTQFIKPIDFHGTAFSGETDFIGVSFSGIADFMDASFGGDAYFRGASFGGDAYFRGASFGGDVYFWDVSFGGDVSFWDASFGGDVYFWDVSFSGIADFMDASFGGDADFMVASFGGDAYFRGASFGGDAYFGYASFSGDAKFDFAEFNKVSFSDTTFTTVSLYETDFNRMKVDWSSLKDALVFNGPAYIKLIKNFREIEQFDDADDAYYQYRRLSQANKKWSVSKLGDIFMWVTCGYGVKPQYTIGCGVVIILVFSFIYWRGYGIRRLKETDGDGSQVSFWDALYFSMVTFTTVGYGDWYPTDKYRKFVMVEGLVGWLTLALFLVTLANVMIRP